MTKKIDLGKVGLAGDTVNVTATLTDSTLGAGDRTDFFVTLKREEGPVIAPISIWIILIGTPDLNLYPPYNPNGNGRINGLEPGESKRIQFLIEYGPESDGSAAFSLLCIIQWDEHPPFVLPTFSVT
jgi:hypothetical protein